MRKQLLWIVTAAAVATPVTFAALRVRETRASAAHLAEGLAVLDAPLERAPHLESVDLVHAQQIFEEVRRADPSGPAGTRARALWHVAQAYADLSRGEVALANEEADVAYRLAPADPHAALVRATVASRRDDVSTADRALDALARTPGVPGSLAARASLLRIDLLLDAGRAHDALDAVEALAREHPQIAPVQNQLGLARAAVGDHEGAREALGRAAQIDPREAAPLVNIARLDREDGDLVAAREVLERALAVVPDSAEAWMAYGVVLVDLHASTARHALVRAGELAPDDAAPWVAQGNLDLAEGNLAGAVESFRNALARAPEHPVAQTNLGIAYARQGDRAAARAAFELATRHAPHMGEAWNGLGALRLAAGDAEGAVGSLQQAATLLPHDPNPALNLGLALEALQRWDDAAHAFHEALRRAPGNDVAQRHLLALLPPAERAREEQRRLRERQRTARFARR